MIIICDGAIDERLVREVLFMVLDMIDLKIMLR
jgi:hypothetical protein